MGIEIYTITPVNQLTDLQLLAAVSPTNAEAGSELTYVFTITNAGPDAASSVLFSNPVPAGLALVSVTASQGSVSTNGSLILVTLGDVPAGGTASITAVTVPWSAGLFTNVASVTGSEIDVNPANNSLAIVSAVGLPVADATIGGAAAPDPVVTGSPVTYTLGVTNLGPDALLNARVVDVLPSGLSLLSAAASQGTVATNGNTVECDLGLLTAGMTAEITIVAQANVAGWITNVATVDTDSSDTNTANNAVSLVSSVHKIVAVGVVITSESLQPANGTPDPGETVTVELTIENRGQSNTTDLVGILLATNGIASDVTNNFGVVTAGGAPATRSFTFTADEEPGSSVVAVWQFKDGNLDLNRVEYVFPTLTTSIRDNTNGLHIPTLGAASVYPSKIWVSEVTGLVSRVEVTLSNLSHEFPDDLDILLQSPAGTQVMLMSDCGGGVSVSNLVLTFSNNAPEYLPNAGGLSSKTFKPTDYETGDILPLLVIPDEPASSLEAFNGVEANGWWSLYVADDAPGESGVLAGGWSLRLTTVQPTNHADLSISGSVAPDPASYGGSVTYTIQVMNHGPASAGSVYVTNTLPEGFLFVSASASPGTCTSIGNRVVCDLGTLAPWTTASITIQATALVNGQVINEAAVTTTAIDMNPVNNLTRISSLVQPVPPPLLSASYDPAADKFIVTVQGVPGLNYVIEATSDFGTWTGKATNIAPQLGTINYTNAPASANRQLYYRAYRAP